MTTGPSASIRSEFVDPDAPTLQLVETFSREQHDGARGSHDWEHTLRVVHLCRHIGPREGADMTILLSAAFLHDIGRSHQDQARGGLCHAAKGEELAAPFVAKLPFSEMQKRNILHSIAAHRFRGRNIPETLEAKVLFDADKLDAIGAVGVARAYLFAGEVGACLHNPDVSVEETQAYSRDDTGYREFRVKLSKIKGRMLTDTGRRMAEDRHRFMEQFFIRFIQEFNGER
jgi:uncharacterized protein